MRARHFRGGEKTPAICIPGLTRNAADFEDLAPKIAGTGRNVIVVNLRGRGLSDYDSNYLNYQPLTYRDDVLRALDQLEIEKAVFVGTSLGGLVTILTNEAAPERVKAAIINDIGPELAPEGIERIAGYVGKNTGPAATIEEAAGRIKAINEVAFPDAVDADWIKFACRTFRLTEAGWVLDYDPKIASALAEVGPAPDTWPAFESFKGKPLLIVRGEISDLLTPPIIEKMRAVNSDFDYAEVPGIGHAPMLTEPAAWTAIEAFLGKID
jgi:pimeloyl-ACP methyl ester carboxylesterase